MDQDILFGFLAVLGSIFSFGFYALPIKSKKIQEAKVSPMVFHFYSGSAVILTCFLVLTYNPFVFSWWGVLSGSMWVICQPLFFTSLALIGYTITPPVVCGLTIVLSFLWGVLFFHEPVRSVGLAILGVGVLTCGIIGVTLSGSGLPDKILFHYQKYKRLRSRESSMMMAIPTFPPGEENEMEGNDPDPDLADLHSAPPEAKTKTSGKDFALGLLMSSTVGLINGSLMVPFAFFSAELESKYPGEFVQLAFLTSFGIGVFLSTPLVALVYFLVRRERPVFHFKITVLPGLLAGTLWSIGNFCSLYAVYYLGNTVGYPLTQANIIISGLFGIFYFKEIRGKAVGFFALAAIILFAGMGMLSYFGGH